jgi:hypothetical protein
LNQCGREPNCVAVTGTVGDACGELEELGRVDDRVRDPGALDQLLLVLGPHVAAVRDPIAADDGQHDVMSHAGCCLHLQDVPRRRLEELEHDGSSNDGELDTSTTTAASARASLRPSPVRVLTPVLGAAGTVS